MKTAISTIRILILAMLGLLGAFLLFGEEQDEALVTWALRFVFDKALAIGAIFLLTRLYKRWSKTDPWLIAYGKMCDEAMDDTQKDL